jgi:hypothetical protein
MTKIAKTVRVEVQGNKPENTHNEATQELLTLSNSHIERLTQHPRLGGRTMSNSSFTQTDNPVAAPPVDPLSELKTVIRFQYKKMLEVVYEAYSSKNTEIYINLFEGLVSIKATIYPVHTRGNTYYAIKLQDHELSRRH